MRPLLLSCYDAHGGAAIAAMRLNSALQRAGADSNLLAQLATRPGVLGPRDIPGKIAMRLRYALEERAKRHCSKAARDFSVNVTPSGTARRVRRLRPNLVHLHWVSHGMLRIEDFSRLGAPLVWTMHDMWPFTGGCHYAGTCSRYLSGCGNCPALESVSDDDLSRTIWRRKQRCWNGLPFQLIAPSRWLASCTRSSALFHDADVAVIPNTLDTGIFRPQEQAAARQRCGLPQGPKLVLFGAIASLSTSRKGAHLLMPALEQLRKMGGLPVELVVLGATGPEPGTTFPLPVHYAGHVTDEALLSAFYASADVVVLPSTEDNFPNVALEALACGRPCTAFEIGGMGDLIVHGETGYLAKPFLSEDLAAGIAFCLRDDQAARLRHQARSRVEQHFAPAIVAQQHLALYEKLLVRSGR